MPRRSPKKGAVDARLANQQLVAPRFTEPADLVRWLGAVQAQDYQGGLWAVGQRLRGAREADVEAAIASRRIVRTWPMRETLHFVAAEDARWMLRLLTPRMVARSAGRRRQLELDKGVLARSRKILARALKSGARLTRPAVYAALARGGVSPAGQRGSHILGHLSQEQVICFGPREGRQPTFVLFEDWVPPADEPGRDEALARLAVRYFTSHGPASRQDFAWWSGLLATEADAAIAAAGTALVREERAGRALWTGPETPPVEWPRPSAALLPPWDDYLVAYKDRQGALGHLTAPPPMIVGRSLIVVDGRVRGSWTRALATPPARIALEFWSNPAAKERRAVEQVANDYARFLGRPLAIAIRSGGRTRP